MIIRKLVIHNIASFADAVIDFDAEPLAGTDVFLISGPTGAGKSSILDAICLALYGEMPRLKNTGMTGRPEGDDTMASDDIRQCLRQGAGEGYVKLAFTANDGNDYTAVWEAHHSRRKADGTLQPASRSIALNGSRSQIVTKRTQLKELAVRLTGLDFDQFCRTSMLAQGDFTRFLKSRDDEKSAILEKITGKNEYAVIGARIFRITAGKREILERLRERTGGIEVMTDSAREAVCAELAAVKTEAKTKSGLRRSKTAILELMRRRAQLGESIANALKILSGATEALDLKLQNSRAHLAEIDKNIELDAPKAEIFDKADSIISRLSEIISAYDTISRSKSLISALDKADGEAVGKYKTTNDALARAGEAVTKATEALADINNQIAGCHLAEAVERNKNLLDNLNKLGKIRRLAYTSASIKEYAAKTHTELDEAEKAKIAASADLTDLKDRRIKAEKNFADADQLYRLACMGREEAAAAMRRLLVPGCECPVCRQKVDALPELSKISDSLFISLQQKYEQASEALKNIDRRYASAQGAYDAAVKSIDVARKALSQNSAKSAEADQALNEALADYGLKSADNLESEIQRIMAESNEVKRILDLGNDLQRRKSILEKNLNTHHDAFKKIEAEKSAIDAAAKEREGSRKAYNEQIASAGKTIETALADLAETGYLPANLSASTANATLASFRADVLRHNSLKQAQDEAAALVARLSTKLSECRNTLQTFNITARSAEIPANISGTEEDKAERCRINVDTLVGELRKTDEAAAQIPEGTSVETLESELQIIDENIAALIRRSVILDEQLQADDNSRRQIENFREQLREAEAEYNRWSRLNELFGSADGAKFRRIALTYILGGLLDAANVYLARLSDRYSLRGIPGTFNIDIVDHYRADAIRSANTSSGGESFLVSLALALALSDISKHLTVDTLFIDEGFGTLSEKPLQSAVALLRNLNKHTGRRVGIISHMEELRRQIPVRIDVQPNPHTGSSELRIICAAE